MDALSCLAALQMLGLCCAFAFPTVVVPVPTLSSKWAVQVVKPQCVFPEVSREPTPWNREVFLPHRQIALDEAAKLKWRISPGEYSRSCGLCAGRLRLLQNGKYEYSMVSAAIKCSEYIARGSYSTHACGALILRRESVRTRTGVTMVNTGSYCDERDGGALLPVHADGTTLLVPETRMKEFIWLTNYHLGDVLSAESSLAFKPSHIGMVTSKSVDLVPPWQDYLLPQPLHATTLRVDGKWALLWCRNGIRMKQGMQLYDATRSRASFVGVDSVAGTLVRALINPYQETQPSYARPVPGQELSTQCP